MSRRIAIHAFVNTLRNEVRPASTPLVSAGRFDTRAIMREAVKLARSINRSFGPWLYRMGIALRTVWKRAKAAMVETCAAEPFAIREPAKTVTVTKSRTRAAFAPIRSTAFVSGSRAFSHGW